MKYSAKLWRVVTNGCDSSLPITLKLKVCFLPYMKQSMNHVLSLDEVLVRLLLDFVAKSTSH